MSEHQPLIIASRLGRTALLTLNRPDARNALTVPMIAEFNAAVRAAERDPEVLAIVITGAGRIFCSGLDVATIAEFSRTGDRKLAERGITPEMPAQFANLLQVTKPVIAAVNGAAVGVGLVLALMCDLRIVAEGAFFSTSFAKLGLTAEHGSSWLLPRLIGTSRALDLLWTSRRVGADEALRIGLADRIAPADGLIGEAERLVAEFAEASPHSMALMKRMIHQHLDTELGLALRQADELASASLSHPDVQEGVAALKERRAPVFQPWTGEHQPNKEIP
jgi:enoyl-CoA hydratase/carnithine racemase